MEALLSNTAVHHRIRRIDVKDVIGLSSKCQFAHWSQFYTEVESIYLLLYIFIYLRQCQLLDLLGRLLSASANDLVAKCKYFVGSHVRAIPGCLRRDTLIHEFAQNNVVDFIIILGSSCVVLYLIVLLPGLNSSV